LQDKGLKCTPQRLAIYAALTASDAHPSAEELYRGVKARYPMLSRNTVYQTLEILTMAGLAQAIRSGRSHARYDGNNDAHHHMVCLSCDRVEDFHDAGCAATIACSIIGWNSTAIADHAVTATGATRAHSHKEDVCHGEVVERNQNVAEPERWFRR